MDDWVMVPREPTPEMLRDAHNVISSTGYRNGLLPEMWSAMIAAAPQQQAEIEAATEKAWQRFSLENIRLFAARRRKEEWAQTILRFCTEAGVSGQPLRDGQAEAAPQQHAEPVATVIRRMKSDGSTHKVATLHVDVDLPEGTQLYAYPRITAEQVEQIKRLADEYAQMKQAHGAFCNAESRKFLDKSRAALHAALDALVKGE